MKVMQPQTHLNKEPPNLWLLQWPCHLSFKMFPNISIFTILHDYVDGISVHIAIVIFANILAIYFRENRSFKCRLPLLIRAHLLSVYLFENVDLFVFFSSDSINDSETTWAKLLQFFEIIVFWTIGVGASAWCWRIGSSFAWSDLRFSKHICF